MGEARAWTECVSLSDFMRAFEDRLDRFFAKPPPNYEEKHERIQRLERTLQHTSQSIARLPHRRSDAESPPKDEGSRGDH